MDNHGVVYNQLCATSGETLMFIVHFHLWLSVLWNFEGIALYVSLPLSQHQLYWFQSQISNICPSLATNEIIMSLGQHHQTLSNIPWIMMEQQVRLIFFIFFVHRPSIKYEFNKDRNRQ